MNTNFTSSCFRRRVAIVAAAGPKVRVSLPRLLRTASIALANEGDQVIGLENEFTIGADGWVKIAPYGRHLKERIVRGADGQLRQEAFEQVLDQAAAETMVRKFKSPIGRLKRFMRGAPIFKHHPDIKDHAPETEGALANDKTPQGIFAELDARDDGFYGKPVMTDSGQAAIENEGLKWLSPFWWARVVKVDGKNVPEAHPYEFISAGLTKNPNIPGGEALANAKATMQRKQIIDALKKVGIALANEATATDEEILQAFSLLAPKATVTALENEKTTLTQAKSTAEELLKSEKTLRTNAEGAVTDLTKALANERTAKVKAVLDTAIVQGRITAAERPGWETRLSGNFDTEVTALANEKPKIKTEATTQNAGERKAEADKGRDASEQFMALANECMAKTNCDWGTAWKRTKKANPALYEAMEAKS